MAGLKKDVVGPGKSTLNPTPTPSPKPTVGSQVTDTMQQRINALLGQSNIPLSGYVSDSAGPGILSELGTKELKTLGLLLKSMGYQVKSLEDARTMLVSGDFPEAYKQPSFNSLVSYIRSQQVGKLPSAANLPTQTVTQYSDTQLKDISNAVAQNFLKRNLEPAEWEAIAPQLKKLVEKGTTTTTQTVGGKNVVTVTPGFSQEAAKTIVEKQLKTSAVDDLKVKQYQDFTDWLSQNMAGM